MKHYIIYSHGFGVDKTDRGLLSDIAASIPEAKHILFDYNEIDITNNTLTVNPLQEQVRRLREKLKNLDDGEEKIIDIIAHSQGCVVAALAKPHNVRNIICLAPPDSLSVDRMVAVFGSRPGSQIDLEGESRIPRRDGTTTIVTKQYWQSIKLDVIKLYNQLPNLVEKVQFYIATDDEVLGMTNFDKTDENIELIQVLGNHDFTGEARTKITKLIKEALM